MLRIFIKLSLLIFFGFSNSVFGQSEIITGTINDKSGSPIPGVNILEDTDVSTSKCVGVGNDSEAEDSEVTQNSNKTVQTEQVRRQQSCSSRASLASQGSVSFFVEFDDCDMDKNDTVFSGNNGFLCAKFCERAALHFLYVFLGI